MEKAKRLSREESQVRTRKLLMQSAASCFAELGFDKASVDQIAENAGFSRGAFYSNFADKDEILFALFKRHLDRDLRDFETILAASDSFEGLVDGLVGRYRELDGNPDWCLLIAEFQLRASRAAAPDDAFARTYADYRSELSRLIETALRRFGRTGRLTPAELAVSLIALSHGLALERAASRTALPMALTAKAMRVLLMGATTDDNE